MRRLKRIIPILAIVLLFLASGCEGLKIKKEIKSVNEELPYIIDDGFELTGIAYADAQSKQVVFNFRVDEFYYACISAVKKEGTMKDRSEFRRELFVDLRKNSSIRHLISLINERNHHICLVFFSPTGSSIEFFPDLDASYHMIKD